MDYEKHYNKLIERAKNRILEGYIEKHHIVPKCVGGNNDFSNIVLLLPEEHYLAHLLLIKMTKYKNTPTFYKLIYAANMMTIGIGRNNKSYGWVKRRLSEVQKKFRAGKKQSLDTIAKRVAKTKGMKRTEETKERCRLAKIGKKRKPFSEKHKEKIGIGNLGKIMSLEARQKISIGNTGKKKPQRSQEHIEKLALSIRGTKNSDDTKKKKSDAAKIAWIKRKIKNEQQIKN